MMKKILDALRGALDALEYIDRTYPNLTGYGVRAQQMEELRQAIAKAEANQCLVPVGTVFSSSDGPTLADCTAKHTKGNTASAEATSDAARQGGDTKPETPTASVDTPEFRGLLPRYWTLPAPTHDFRNLVAHINAWADERTNAAINQLAASRAVLPVTDQVVDALKAAYAELPTGRALGLVEAALEACALATPVAGWVSVEKDGVVEQLRKALRESQLGHGSYGPHYSGEALAERIEAIIASLVPPAPVTPKQEQS